MKLPPESDSQLSRRARRWLYALSVLLALGTGCAHLWIAWVSGVRESIHVLPSTTMACLVPAAVYFAGAVILTKSRAWAAVLEWLCALHGIGTTVLMLFGLFAIAFGFDPIAGLALVAAYFSLTVILVRLTFLLGEYRSNYLACEGDTRRGFELVLTQPVDSSPAQKAKRDTGF